jgi:7-carboxy-7-deazaguanine synthase
VRISEIYASLQGEGLLAGTPSTFVRTSGCNLRCGWCDTPFTSWEPSGDELSLADVFTRVAALGMRHVVVTGGEPLLFAEAAELCLSLRRAGHHVTVETAGTVRPAAAGPVADLMSLSPKLASSAPPLDTPRGWHARHEATRRRDDVLRDIAAAGRHQFKFVIDSEADLAEAREWLDALGAAVDRAAIFMMPQGRTAAELATTSAWLEGECRRSGFRFAPRHHIAWFGTKRGT